LQQSTETRKGIHGTGVSSLLSAILASVVNRLDSIVLIIYFIQLLNNLKYEYLTVVRIMYLSFHSHFPDR